MSFLDFIKNKFWENVTKLVKFSKFCLNLTKTTIFFRKSRIFILLQEEGVRVPSHLTTTMYLLHDFFHFIAVMCEPIEFFANNKQHKNDISDNDYFLCY